MSSEKIMALDWVSEHTSNPIYQMKNQDTERDFLNKSPGYCFLRKQKLEY